MALSFSHHPLLLLHHGNKIPFALRYQLITSSKPKNTRTYTYSGIRCSSSFKGKSSINLKTCKNCKTQFDPAINHPLACRFHTAHFGGETKRKFESVYEGGTMNTPDSGKVFQYWHCCGSEDPFDPGETKRKFESVYEGGTMNTPDSGKVFQYWHCCGSEDPFDPGCTASPHASYDD